MQSLFQDEVLPESKYVRKSVLVPYPVDKAYDYALPDDVRAGDGDYVCVPLGAREVVGVVMGDGAQDEADKKIDPKKLKSVLSRYDLPPLPDVHREFLKWVAHYTMAPLGSVLKLTLSVPAAFTPPAPTIGYKLPPDYKDGMKLTDKQKAVIAVMQNTSFALRASEIADQADCTSGVVTAMASKGLLIKEEIYSAAPCQNPDSKRNGPILSDFQRDAADNLKELVNSNTYAAALLDGVTGAGKTEVYFEGVAAALDQGKQVLILLPEIALSNAFLDRFKVRFGCAPALWHSSLSPARRRNTWRGVASGETKVIIGARSALFLPYQDLGLIIVDEEHDPAYKQEDNVIYNARNMAIKRAHMGGFPICLVSATPSMETMHNAWNGRYHHLTLPNRHGDARLPDIHVIDMKKDKLDSQHFIGHELQDAVKQTVERGEQALLFLNRRGYAPLTLCRTCGHRFECPRCSAWMVEHKRTKRLHCHHCDHYMNVPQQCPACDDQDSLAACGPGVERILEEAKEIFPEAHIAVLSSDTADTHDKLKEILASIHAREVDIIVGTQIIAKGHHFPKLTCVGVIDADLGLSGGDLRASERTYQLLHQVAGRAGRAEDPGHVYLQSYFPDNRVMQALASNDRDTFLEVEEEERESAHMPPFSRLAGIIVSGRDEEQVANFSRALGRCAPQGAGLRTLGPAEAPIYRLRGKYRRRLLVQADKKIDIQKTISHWLSSLKTPSTIRVQVDIDPQSFL